MLADTCMENPWLKLRRDSLGGTFVLDIDRDYIEQHNTKYDSRPELKVMINSIPEPFIGDPDSAKLVLLNLNPGHSKEDENRHRDPKMKEALFRNLRHEEQRYPFYPLNPDFADTGVGAWWRKRTRKLHEAVGVEALAKKLLVIEWFPYHSVKCKSGISSASVKSQAYSHLLAMEMLQRNGVVVLGMRAKDRWTQLGNGFERVPFLNNPQNVSITERNMSPGLFSHIVETLKQS